ncbi:hypothetical protein CDC21_32715 [Pseudomonas aeruginosa]|uniref:DUF7666 domain-containing protein n=1 Tax=Pseudomonas aeruginosa TaxID=287 RepID=UPI000B48FBAA|nr:hypothetical protein [Pseudomonas aeruginosa]MCU9412018.1 hypothetical protein [Pseudomonas aeruginosa]OWI71800.1 hypothetical protein CDC21_32715 [Pseudomonas aeruginosa]HCF0797809.1 hypothetical protein [Pseudomonas aeruginosa]
MTAYKGFKQDLTCRDYQFEIGGTYKHDGEVEACASGFHSCEYPLDVFGYYAPGKSRFAIVKASGQLSRHDDDSKIASATLVVEAEISMPTMISRALDWIMSKVDKSVEQTVVGGTASNTGNQSAAEVSGKESVAASLGIEGRARASAGSAIVLCHRDDEGRLIHIRASKVGENGVEPDTWYQLNAEGEFVEFDE